MGVPVVIIQQLNDNEEDLLILTLKQLYSKEGGVCW